MSADVNAQLIKAIRARQSDVKSLHNYGILTGDRYALTLEKCVGSDLCYRYGSKGNTSFTDAVKRASRTLTYNNEDMVAQDIYTDFKAKTRELGADIELPKNTLMVFKHILTTPRKDRDGDILRTQGAKVDPKMLLLWQHVHTLPIGKMLAVVEHTSKQLVVVSAVVGVNELAEDAAVMIDNGMGRFSHGFRALSYTDIKEENGRATGKSGFDVKEFEVMEESLVSVPANPDAETLDVILGLVEGDKLSSSMMKSYGKQIREQRTSRQFSGGLPEELAEKKADDHDCGCGKKPADCDCDDKPGKPSKEADADGDETKRTQDAKVMCPECDIPLVNGECTECGWTPQMDDKKSTATKGTEGDTKGFNSYYGPLPGSWEATQDALRETAKQHFLGNVDGYAWLVSTKMGEAVVRVESYKAETSSPPPVRYFKSAWEIVDDVPTWKGSPVEVELKVSASIIEKRVDFEKFLAGDKQFEGEKAGRVLSKSNYQKLSEVHEDLKEINTHCSTRSGKALCEKCSGKVKEVLDGQQVDDMDIPDSGKSFEETCAELLLNSTPEQRQKLLSAVSAVVTVDNRTKETWSFRKAIFGRN